MIAVLRYCVYYNNKNLMYRPGITHNHDNGQFQHSGMVKVKEDPIRNITMWYTSFDNYTVVKHRSSSHKTWSDLPRSHALLIYRHLCRNSATYDTSSYMRKSICGGEMLQQRHILSLTQFLWEEAGKQLASFPEIHPSLSQVLWIESIVLDMMAWRPDDAAFLELREVLLGDLRKMGIREDGVNDLRSLVAFLDRIQLLKDRTSYSRGMF